MPTLPSPVPRSTNLAIAGLLESAEAYASHSKATSTLRVYDSAWRAFAAWCTRHGLVPLPAEAETVAAYAADAASRIRPSTITTHVVAISQAHALARFDDPTRDVRVKSVLRGIRRTHGRPSTGKHPLLVGDVIAIVRALDLTTMAGLRDRALLLLGFAGALRRSELVALTVADLEFRPSGLALRIRKSKTDQEGRGRLVGVSYGSDGTCPVVAVRLWMQVSGIMEGQVLRAVDRHGRVRAGGLAPKSVCRIVKRLAALAGLDGTEYGGHSLRSGFATSAAAAGVSERDIATVTGHRSLVVLRRYIRHGTLLDGDFSRRVGL